MANKLNNQIVDLLKQYIPKVQADETRLGTQMANVTDADAEQLKKQAIKAGAEGKKQKQMLLNARKTSADKSIPFTFPTGETKLWDKMSPEEKSFVEGQSLRTKGRTNEDPSKESLFDAYINPLNMLGNLAANAAEAEYTAKQSDSNMPYVTAYGLPLLMGRAMGSNSINPLSKEFYTKSISDKKFFNNLIGGLEQEPVKSKGKVLLPKPNPELMNGSNVTVVPKNGVKIELLEPKFKKSNLKKIEKEAALDELANKYYNLELHSNIPKGSESFKNLIKERQQHYNKKLDIFKYEPEFQKQFKDFIEKNPPYKPFGQSYEKDLNLFAHLAEDLETPSFYGAPNKKRPDILEMLNESKAMAEKFKGAPRNYTTREKNLVRAFSRGYDRRLNKLENLEAFNKSLYDPLREEFENTVTKKKLQQPVTVRRGDNDWAVKHVWRNGEKLPEGSVKYSELQPGDEWMPDKFTSTSFKPQSGFGDIESQIELPAGQSVAMPNLFKNPEFLHEKELILPQKLKFKVEKNLLQNKGFKNFNEVPEDLLNDFKKIYPNFYERINEAPDIIKVDMINRLLPQYIERLGTPVMRHSITNPYMTIPGMFMLKQLMDKNKNKKTN
jgi:hypothetical protein